MNKLLNLLNTFMSFLFFCLIVFSISCSKKTTEITIVTPNMESSDTPNTISTVISDMSTHHEAIPHGVPSSYDWYSEPVIHHATPPTGFLAITNWGQFYEEAHGNPATNTRVQIRNLKTYYLSIQSGTWVQLQNELPIIDGNWFPENFQGSLIEGDDHNETEGISATAGNGYCFHYWNRDRASITPSDIGGIFTTCEARIIVANPDLPDDRLDARYVLNMGADYWSSVTGGYVDEYGIGMGRFKYVRTGWTSYNFTTVSSATLTSNPPPLN